MRSLLFTLVFLSAGWAEAQSPDAAARAYWAKILTSCSGTYYSAGFDLDWTEGGSSRIWLAEYGAVTFLPPRATNLTAADVRNGIQWRGGAEMKVDASRGLSGRWVDGLTDSVAMVLDNGKWLYGRDLLTLDKIKRNNFSCALIAELKSSQVARGTNFGRPVNLAGRPFIQISDNCGSAGTAQSLPGSHRTILLGGNNSASGADGRVFPLVGANGPLRFGNEATFAVSSKTGLGFVRSSDLETAST